MIARFIGMESEIQGFPRLERLGQGIDLPAELLRDAIVGGCPLLPDADFQEIGFTDEELTRFASPMARARATEEFSVKLKAAFARLSEIRAHMEEV